MIVGEEDELTPRADSERMQRATARSQLVVVPGAGHLSNLEAPEAFSAALANFLTVVACERAAVPAASR